MEFSFRADSAASGKCNRQQMTPSPDMLSDFACNFSKKSWKTADGILHHRDPSSDCTGRWIQLAGKKVPKAATAADLICVAEVDVKPN
jgi:hypothetical protein